jgi:predicted DNA-binding protein
MPGNRKDHWVTIRLDEETERRLRTYSAFVGQKMSNVAREMIQAELHARSRDGSVHPYDKV